MALFCSSFNTKFLPNLRRNLFVTHISIKASGDNASTADMFVTPWSKYRGKRKRNKVDGMTNHTTSQWDFCVRRVRINTAIWGGGGFLQALLHRLNPALERLARTPMRIGTAIVHFLIVSANCAYDRMLRFVVRLCLSQVTYICIFVRQYS